MKNIKITANGDLDGAGCTLPMNVWHEILETQFKKLYPGAEIDIDGDANTTGNDSAYLYDDADDDEVDLRDEVARIYDAACDDPRWVMSQE